MRQFRIFYLHTSDPRFWSCDIEVEDDEAWDDAAVRFKQLDNSQLFPDGSDLDKKDCEFTSTIELAEDGYKGEPFSTIPRVVTDATTPDAQDFPQAEVVQESISGLQVQRVVSGLSSNYVKYRRSALRAKVGLDKGSGSGYGFGVKKLTPLKKVEK